jgi:hypothetical protein
MHMTKMHSIQAAAPCGRRRRRGPPILVAALVAVLSVAVAAPALAAGPPTVTNLIPRHATSAGGTSVTIIGENLSGATAVKFGETNATSFTVNSNTMITAVSPPRTGTATVVDVTVTTPEGTSPPIPAELEKFHYLLGCQEGHAPAVTSVEPHSGPSGTSVTIKGERFFQVVCTSEGFSVERVLFGFTEATSFNSPKEGEIVAVAPPGTGTVDVTVESFLGQSAVTPSDLFTYPASAPTVTNVEPHSGPAAGGSSVTVNGTNFTGESVVKFGSTTAASVTVNSATSITAVSPAGTGRVDVTVTTSSGTSPTSEADRFTYGPTVTKVEPKRGSQGGGTTVTLTGTGFTGVTAVHFGATSAKSFTVNSAASITAVSPKVKGTGTVDVTVTTPAGTSPTSAADQFTFSKK